MSQSLGEKLRQAREDKGLTLADVAEQTRISSLYLEAIENDSYKILPGGIFNKGFVKSYAKFVGINEQEALMDYQAILASSESSPDSDLRVYKPEVLTDDRSGSMMPTIIVAALVLGLMTVGILYLVSYLRAPASTTVSTAGKSANTSSSENQPANSESPQTSGVPDMSGLKVELKATTQPVKVITGVDGAGSAPTNIAAGSTATFEPKQNVTINYLRWNATVLQLYINGKQIILPTTPLKPEDRDRIIFTISSDTLPQIWNSGAVGDVPATEANTSTAPASAPTPRLSPKPAVNANTSASNIGVPKPTMQSKPTPKPTIITVGTPKPLHE